MKILDDAKAIGELFDTTTQTSISHKEHFAEELDAESTIKDFLIVQ